MQIQPSLDFSLGQAVDYSQLPDSINYVRDIWTSDLTDKILSQKEVAIDIETYGVDVRDGLRFWAGNIATVQFGFRDGTVIIADIKTIKNIGNVKETVRRLFELPDVIKLGHNLKFDITFLLYHFKLRNIYRIRDTMITSQMCYLGVLKNAKQPISHSLQACAQRQLGIEVDKTQQRSDFGKANLEVDQIIYAAKDVQLLFPLWDSLAARCIELGNTTVVAVKNEVVAVFARIQVNGVKVDLDYLMESKAWYESKVAQYTAMFREACPGQKMSGNGLASFIEGMLNDNGIDTNTLPHTAQGLLQVNAAFFELDIIEAFPGLKILSEIRSLNKHLDYIQGIIDNQRNGRVFTSYNSMTATSLGRSTSGKFTDSKLAYDGINLQNCPGKYDDSDDAKKYAIKKSFLVDVIADLSAAHSKIAVQVANDTLSAEVESADGDIHLFTAAGIEQMNGGKLTFDEMMVIQGDKKHPEYDRVKGLRDLAKQVRYSSFNLGGSARLQQTLQKAGYTFTQEECKTAIKAWRVNHKPIYDYQMRVIAEANKHDITFPDSEYTYGKTTNLVGDVLFMRKDFSKFSEKMEVKAADCCSHKWMSVESHIMNKAMINIQKKFDAHPEWQAKLVNIVHDELNAECLPEYQLEVAKVVFHGMDDQMKAWVKIIPTTTDTADKCMTKTWADK